MSALKWPLFGSNRGGRPDIGKQNANVKEMKRGGENDEVRARKRLRYRKTFVRGKWISRPLWCVHRGNFYWFSVRLDSQRSFRTHTSLSPLNPTISFLRPLLLHLLPPITLPRFEVLSPSVHRYLGRNGFLHRCSIWRILFPISPLSSPFTFSIFTPRFLSIFRRQFDSTGESRSAPKLVWWIPNKRIHFVKFQLPTFARGTASRILITSRARTGVR